MFESILISIITSSSLIGLFIFITKKYFEKYINSFFDKKLEQFKSDLSTNQKTYEALLKKKLDFYPKLVENLYKNRNLARDIVNDLPNTNEEEIKVFISSCNGLVENLYSYRFFLSEDEFRKIHLLKNTLTGFGLKLDTYHKVKSKNDNGNDAI